MGQPREASRRGVDAATSTTPTSLEHRVCLCIWGRMSPCAWAPRCRYLITLAALHATACASHTSSVVMHTAKETVGVCQIAVEVSDGVASDLGLRNAIPPGFEPSPLTDGSVVLASYRSYRGADGTVAGSEHNVYVTVFARNQCQEISFAITDYDSSVRTDYVEQIRSTLTARLRERRPDAEIVIEEVRSRDLPP